MTTNRPLKKIEECLDKAYFSVGKIKTQDNLSEGKFPIIDQGKELIAGYSNDESLVYDGKLPVIIYGDHTNIVKYVDFPFICGADGTKVFKLKNDIDTKFFVYWLEHFKPETQGYRRHYSLLKEIIFPLPPLATQQLIVAKLDETFAQIDEAIVTTQDNIQKTEEFTGAILDKVFKEKGVEKRKLSEICMIDPKKALINNVSEDTEVSFVPMADMNQEKMYFESKQTRKIGDVRKGYTYFEDDDVLLAKVTPCFENGKSGIAKDLKNGIGFGSSEYIVLRKNKDILAKYIYYIVSSKYFREEGAKNMSGAVGLQRVKKEWLHNYLIPLPSLSRQIEIVAELDNIFFQTEELKSQYQEKLIELKALKASVLQSAFEGKLI